MADEEHGDGDEGDAAWRSRCSTASQHVADVALDQAIQID